MSADQPKNQLNLVNLMSYQSAIMYFQNALTAVNMASQNQANYSLFYQNVL
jgi:hypothetical protein